MVAEVTKEARVQIELQNGELYDLKEVQRLENVIVGDNETHRLVFRCEKPVYPMGKIIRKVVWSDEI